MSYLDNGLVRLGVNLDLGGSIKTQTTAVVFWRSGGKPYSSEMSTNFPVIGDGRFRVYEVNLAGHPLYRGVIAGLRIDPVVSAEPGASVRIKSITLGK